MAVTYWVRSKLGNQGYDAVVYDENKREIERVEITAPHDGKAENVDARQRVSRGYGTVTVGTPGDDFDEFFKQVLVTCQKKARMDYRECSLVVSIAPLPPFAGFEDKYESQVAVLVDEMAKIKYKAKRVFLLILPDRLEVVHGSRDVR